MNHDMEYLQGTILMHIIMPTEHMHGQDVHNHDAEYIHEHRKFCGIMSAGINES